MVEGEHEHRYEIEHGGQQRPLQLEITAVDTFAHKEARAVGRLCTSAKLITKISEI